MKSDEIKWIEIDKTNRNLFYNNFDTKHLYKIKLEDGSMITAFVDNSILVKDTYNRGVIDTSKVVAYCIIGER